MNIYRRAAYRMVVSKISQEAIFIGANKQSQAFDYNQSEELVAYAASNTVALWNPLLRKGTHTTLKKHTKEITAVKFLPNSKFLISAGEDSEINIWKSIDGAYSLHQTLTFHTESITCLAVINEQIFATGCADGSISLWRFDSFDNNFRLSYDFQVKQGFYPLCLALQNVDQSDKYILAIGGTTTNIYIYSLSLPQGDCMISNIYQSAVLTGHEDWIKCLLFTEVEFEKNYILASGSQDRYVRLWRVRLNDQIDNSDEDESKLTLLSNKQYKFNIGENVKIAISFEALIMGHDDWITGLQWNPSCKSNSKEKALQLLSSSADTALMIWEMDIESGIWCCVNRLGELSIKGASTATGASGGFWSCLWFCDNETQCILANGKTGSIRMYKSTDAKTFESILGITGPNKEVTNVKWSLDGTYFSATSLDQTTRLFAPWISENKNNTWHEFSRPQIHGYDMICLDNISSSKYVSGGDEKVLRVFEITKSISKLLKKFCDIDIISDESENALPESATLPVLGLSNKAANEQLEAGEAFQQEDTEASKEAQPEEILDSLETPPLEDHLQRYTLYPEIEKLYGHGYEITSCAASIDGTLIASACRSNSAKHAVIRVFRVMKEFQQCEQVLEGHNLTITNMQFSDDSKYLVSVSRDRQFCLWKVMDENEGKFDLLEINPKAHNRIIWDCSWAPTNNFGAYFVTGSRDKTIKLWEVSDKVYLVCTTKLPYSVTSVSCYKSLTSNFHLIIAVGLDNGNIYIFTVDMNTKEKEFNLKYTFDTSITPAQKVSKLEFSRKLHGDNKHLLLSVGSDDSSVRLYSIEYF